MRVAIIFPGLKGTPANRRSIGDVYEGPTYLDIVEGMKDDSMFTSGLTIGEYVKQVKTNCSRLFGIKISPVGETDFDLAKSLITEMQSAGLAVIIKPFKK